MLHITNGGHAVGGIRAAGVPGEVFAWNDVLHDGPVPADVLFNQLRALRAQFIFDAGWRSFEEGLREFAERDRKLESSLDHDEVVLWFEHDLYDQLQMLQLLDWFATCELGATRLSLICDAEYLGPSTPARLAERFPARREVSDEQLVLARRAWSAFRAPDPTAIEDFDRHDSSPLPFVNAALARHLEQFPSTRNGLSRTEAQALDVIAGGNVTLGNAFISSHVNREDPFFLGDTTFALHISALSVAPEPLVLTAQGARLSSDGAHATWNTPLRLTDAGHAVVAGTADYVALNGIDRWYGGVHLLGPEAEWRWDAEARRLISSSA